MYNSIARGFLLALVIAAALGVVDSQNLARKLFVSLQQE